MQMECNKMQKKIRKGVKNVSCSHCGRHFHC